MTGIKAAGARERKYGSSANVEREHVSESTMCNLYPLGSVGHDGTVTGSPDLHVTTHTI